MTRRLVLCVLLLGGPVLAGGCARSGGGASSPQGGAGAAITNTDPCAMRLHDLSGALLAHWMVYYEFPAELSQLSPELVQVPVPEPICPVSGKAYIYNRAGILLPERNARVLLYDAEPSHSNMRWTITVEEPEESGLPVTKVIALPESFFLLRPPG